jgi:hypothetical protein
VSTDQRQQRFEPRSGDEAIAYEAGRREEREAIITYGAGWIEGYTGDDLPEVAMALDGFLTDLRERQHDVD